MRLIPLRDVQLQRGIGHGQDLGPQRRFRFDGDDPRSSVGFPRLQ